MKGSVVYALDFDGVLCDSAVETGISGWKAAKKMWSDFASPLPPTEFLDQFRLVRPIMGTGYEAILVARLLNNGDSVENILTHFSKKKEMIVRESNLQIDTLKELFGETRDQWINDDIEHWIEMNPLFSGITEKLEQLSNKSMWYIVTTKQERFVKKILNANQVNLSDDRIFGLDRQKSKAEILTELLKIHHDDNMFFVEDMLVALSKVQQHKQLQKVKLFLASWGYNTEKDLKQAGRQGVEVIHLNDFLV